MIGSFATLFSLTGAPKNRRHYMARPDMQLHSGLSNEQLFFRRMETKITDKAIVTIDVEGTLGHTSLT